MSSAQQRLLPPTSFLLTIYNPMNWLGRLSDPQITVQFRLHSKTGLNWFHKLQSDDVGFPIGSPQTAWVILRKVICECIKILRVLQVDLKSGLTCQPLHLCYAWWFIFTYCNLNFSRTLFLCYVIWWCAHRISATFTKWPTVDERTGLANKKIMTRGQVLLQIQEYNKVHHVYPYQSPYD